MDVLETLVPRAYDDPALGSRCKLFRKVELAVKAQSVTEEVDRTLLHGDLLGL